jgi:hypothetical protein
VIGYMGTLGSRSSKVSRQVSSQNKCESCLLRANWARTVAHYLRMKDGDLFGENPDFVGLGSVYRGCVTYVTIHVSCGLGFPTAQIEVGRNRSSTSQRIAKWGVFIGLCECSEVIHSHLASYNSQIFSDLTAGGIFRSACGAAGRTCGPHDRFATRMTADHAGLFLSTSGHCSLTETHVR